MPETLRTFIAIPLPEEQRREITLFAKTHHIDRTMGFRPVSASNIHISLRFLGETSVQTIELVKQNLVRIATETPPFLLQIEGVGCFPDWNRPRVVWAGVEPLEQLSQLFQKIESALLRLNCALERGKFSPHVTIARVSERSQGEGYTRVISCLRSIPKPVFGQLQVNKMVYYQSVLQPGGPVYSPLSQHRFQP